jgi:hypothetical protein
VPEFSARQSFDGDGGHSGGGQYDHGQPVAAGARRTPPRRNDVGNSRDAAVDERLQRSSAFARAVKRSKSGLRRSHSRWRYGLAWLLSLPAVLLCSYLVYDIALTFLESIELRREVFASWGTLLVTTTAGWAVVTGKALPHAIALHRLAIRALVGLSFISWVLLLGYTLNSGLADRPNTQFELIALAMVAAWLQLSVVTVGVLKPGALTAAVSVAASIKSIIVEGVSPLLIVSSAFVLTVLATEAWAALLEAPWRAVLLIWLACAASSAALVSRGTTSRSTESQTAVARPWQPMRSLGLLLTISLAAAAIFFSLGGALVPRNTAEVWMGLRDAGSGGSSFTCFDPRSDCAAKGNEYLSVLTKISVLLSGMAMIGSVGSIREKDRS